MLILAHSKETLLFANVERGDIMVVVGVTRRIDDLGRITIPSEIRKTYQLDKNDPVIFLMPTVGYRIMLVILLQIRTSLRCKHLKAFSGVFA